VQLFDLCAIPTSSSTSQPNILMALRPCKDLERTAGGLATCGHAESAVMTGSELAAGEERLQALEYL
jgi:hypothetical protein